MPQVTKRHWLLVDILLNMFSKDPKESLKNLNAPEAGGLSPGPE